MAYVYSSGGTGRMGDAAVEDALMERVDSLIAGGYIGKEKAEAAATESYCQDLWIKNIWWLRGLG